MTLQERDINFLNNLYKNKVYGAGQAKRAYYGNMPFGYNRLRELKKEGYIDSKPYVEGRQKITEVYWITNKGIAELNTKNPRESHKNKPEDKYLMGRQLLINEIHIRLKQLENQNQTESVWLWTDSRETKENKSMNRGDIISGSLCNQLTKTEYAIYVPGTIQNDGKMIARHQTEIDRHNTLRNNMIFCTTADIFNRFRKMIPAGRSMMVLPFDEGIALTYNLLTKREQLIDLFSSVMQIDKDDIKENSTIISTHKAGNLHLVELLTNDIVLQDNITKLYLTDKKQDSLYVLCWDTQLKDLQSWTNDVRVKLFPLQWANNPLFNGVDRSYRQIGRTRKLAKDEKCKSISTRLPPAELRILENIKKQTSMTTSDILLEAFRQSPLYKQYKSDKAD